MIMILQKKMIMILQKNDHDFTKNDHDFTKK